MFFKYKQMLGKRQRVEYEGLVGGIQQIVDNVFDAFADVLMELTSKRKKREPYVLKNPDIDFEQVTSNIALSTYEESIDMGYTKLIYQKLDFINSKYDELRPENESNQWLYVALHDIPIFLTRLLSYHIMNMSKNDVSGYVTWIADCILFLTQWFKQYEESSKFYLGQRKQLSVLMLKGVELHEENKIVTPANDNIANEWLRIYIEERLKSQQKHGFVHTRERMKASGSDLLTQQQERYRYTVLLKMIMAGLSLSILSAMRSKLESVFLMKRFSRDHRFLLSLDLIVCSCVQNYVTDRNLSYGNAVMSQFPYTFASLYPIVARTWLHLHYLKNEAGLVNLLPSGIQVIELFFSYTAFLGPYVSFITAMGTVGGAVYYVTKNIVPNASKQSESRELNENGLRRGLFKDGLSLVPFRTVCYSIGAFTGLAMFMYDYIYDGSSDALFVAIDDVNSTYNEQDLMGDQTYANMDYYMSLYWKADLVSGVIQTMYHFATGAERVKCEKSSGPQSLLENKNAQDKQPDSDHFIVSSRSAIAENLQVAWEKIKINTSYEIGKGKRREAGTRLVHGVVATTVLSTILRLTNPSNIPSLRTPDEILNEVLYNQTRQYGPVIAGENAIYSGNFDNGDISTPLQTVKKYLASLPDGDGKTFLSAVLLTDRTTVTKPNIKWGETLHKTYDQVVESKTYKLWKPLKVKLDEITSNDKEYFIQLANKVKKEKDMMTFLVSMQYIEIAITPVRFGQELAYNVTTASAPKKWTDIATKNNELLEFGLETLFQAVGSMISGTTSVIKGEVSKTFTWSQTFAYFLFLWSAANLARSIMWLLIQQKVKNMFKPGKITDQATGNEKVPDFASWGFGLFPQVAFFASVLSLFQSYRLKEEEDYSKDEAAYYAGYGNVFKDVSVNLRAAYPQIDIIMQSAAYKKGVKDRETNSNIYHFNQWIWKLMKTSISPVIGMEMYQIEFADKNTLTIATPLVRKKP
jgi:hypothetical protein